MKALSIRQPWASLVAFGLKTVECRTWKTSYRGPLLICSSKGDFELEDGLITPGGMALGVVELVDIAPMVKADLENAFLLEEWEADALKGYAWHVRRLYEIKPFPIKGKLNIYNVDCEEKDLEKLPPDVDHCMYLQSLKGR